MQELIDNEWDTWPVDFPLLPGNPAEGSLDLHFWEIARLLYYWVKKFIDELEDKAHLHHKNTKIHIKDDDDDDGFLAHFFDEVKDKIDDIKEDWDELKDDIEDEIDSVIEHIKLTTKQIEQFFDKRVADKDITNYKHPSALQYLMRKLKLWLEEEFTDLLEDNDDIRRLYICADLALAVIEGLLEDKVFKRGFASINHLDFRAWLLKHGANEEFSVDSAPVRGFYDLVFAYENGNFDKPNVEAGVAILAMLRIAFCYRGGVMWKMQAGMGDVIFSPIYELLIKRGVKFEFFNQVDELIPKQDALGHWRINELKITQQVKLKQNAYHPLVNVKDIPCWPSTPLLEQIDDAQAALIKANNINLESFYTNWPDVYQQAFGEPLPQKTLHTR